MDRSLELTSVAPSPPRQITMKSLCGVRPSVSPYVEDVELYNYLVDTGIGPRAFPEIPAGMEGVTWEAVTPPKPVKAKAEAKSDEDVKAARRARRSGGHFAAI